ncbi:MAG: electron transport complex subunit RsxG [Marinobacter sp.]|uniref:electron transport complex subunit RsxG n=1 Tax=Marinobacter sp. TaxID=50741 RepID=UPI00299D0CD9|nr:electron transport complex subunit RsxG [Marinobacter sp.]MDX1757443.1 electron transport complex subunit RsxG [Marinobacter sp.]
MAALGQSIRRSAIGLGLFAVITGGTIAVTQVMTEERIEQQIARAEARALFEIIPETVHDNNMLEDAFELPADPERGFRQPFTAWKATSQGQPVGIILPVTAPDGYSGDIKLLVGIDPVGKVLGVRVTSHKETPGLGDKVERKKSDWVLDFNGRSLDNPGPEGWTVAKNGGVFDQFTGATITPRAVTKAVHKALLYFRTHQPEILQAFDGVNPQEQS